MKEKRSFCEWIRCGKGIVREESEMNNGMCIECHENESLKTVKRPDYYEE